MISSGTRETCAFSYRTAKRPHRALLYQTRLLNFDKRMLPPVNGHSQQYTCHQHYPRWTIVASGFLRPWESEGCLAGKTRPKRSECFLLFSTCFGRMRWREHSCIHVSLEFSKIRGNAGSYLDMYVNPSHHSHWSKGIIHLLSFSPFLLQYFGALFAFLLLL